MQWHKKEMLRRTKKEERLKNEYIYEEKQETKTEEEDKKNK